MTSAQRQGGGTPSQVPWIGLADATNPATFEDFWSIREVPVEGDETWQYAEPQARVGFDSGAVSISVDRFERSHNSIQRFDNPKHLLAATSVFELRAGALWLGIDLAGRKHGGGSDDVRDGFASFNVVDYETGLIFDIVTTSTRLAAIWERHPRAGEHDFTNVIDSPLHLLPTAPAAWQAVAVRIDVRRRLVQYFADDVMFFESPTLPVVPTSVRVAIGLFTLRPIVNGQSTSLRGQGMTGSWRRLRYSYEDVE